MTEKYGLTIITVIPIELPIVLIVKKALHLLGQFSESVTPHPYVGCYIVAVHGLNPKFRSKMVHIRPIEHK